MKLTTVAAAAALPALALAAPAPIPVSQDVTPVHEGRTLLLLAVGALLFDGLKEGSQCKFGNYQGYYAGKCANVPVFTHSSGSLCPVRIGLSTGSGLAIQKGWNAGLAKGCSWGSGSAGWKRDEEESGLEARGDATHMEEERTGLLLGLLGLLGSHSSQKIPVQYGSGGHGWNGFNSGVYVHNSGYLNCNGAKKNYQVTVEGHGYKYAGCDSKGVQYWDCGDGYARPLQPCEGESIGGSWSNGHLQCPQGWTGRSINELD
ncbi:uncharacterized protein EHS24_007647 [Apiotrichum porosum]|uniref:Uncharacterized protein n=1 Tax=Apiotrichum porosum TaxID=105984 RepID=A0A427XUX5_9TREE|nr:uncharacterized protein EHS24_007647 [Apiotrichum porosum]RSH82654.1 hypothetical protein EHS24_007647 [Apiotrichum porosum]